VFRCDTILLLAPVGLHMLATRAFTIPGKGGPQHIATSTATCLGYTYDHVFAHELARCCVKSTACVCVLYRLSDCEHCTHRTEARWMREIES
jgi:hypothetical protein